jgi:hypothetical protein
MDRHVDANAVGGIFLEVYGRDLTAEPGTCLDCGAVNPLGALILYRDCPGQVLHCPECGSVQMVIVELRQGYEITIESLETTAFD